MAPSFRRERAVSARQRSTVPVPQQPSLALARDHAGPIPLLVTDVVMRDMTGRVLADELAAFRPDTRALYVSGYTEDTIVHRGVLEGDVDFVPKPFTPVTLARRVRLALDRRS